MDSEYIRQNEIHEKYVLNQLDEKEKVEYEAFLIENSQAQKELDETRALIEGVRAAGKNAMHKEISRQVEEWRQPKTDWSILYKAAAVLFIFVIVPSVIYYQLTEPAKTYQQEQVTNISAPKQDLDDMDKEKEKSAEALEATNQPEVEEKETAKPVESLQPKKRAAQASGAAGAGYESDAVIIEKDKAADYKNNMRELKTTTTKGIQAEALRSEAPMAKATMPQAKTTRNLIFSKYNPPVELILFKGRQKEIYPQKLDLHITEDEAMMSINLAVSPTIFSMKDGQIKIKLNPENEWLISFADSVSYKLNLDTDPPFAQKMQK